MFIWIKTHKKLVILIIVLALLLTGFLVIRSKAKEAMAALTPLTEETAFVERRSIQSSISSTGEIISDNTRNIAATLTGYEVLTVNVEVGDIVSEGDVLCVFDTEDLEESLEDAEDALSAARTQSKVAVNNAERALEMAIETKNYQIESAARNIISAGEAYEKASDGYDEVKDKLKEMKKARDEAKRALDALPPSIEQTEQYQAVQQAQAELDAAAAALSAYVSNTNTGGTGEGDGAGEEGSGTGEGGAATGEEGSGADEGGAATGEEGSGAEDTDQGAGTEPGEDPQKAALEQAVADAQAKLSAARAALDALDLDSRRAALQKAYNEADAACDTLESSLNTAENAVDSAWLALQNAQAAYDYTVASQESSFRGSKDALKSAEAGAGVATIQQESSVDSLNKQIEKGAVTADIGGTVTAVNIKEGERYAGGAIVTIQDTDALVVSAEIDEYDIADVKIGMKAVFKTDSTRDEQLTGEVIFIAPTPTMGSDVTYQVKVRIDSDTSRLRIGMNAKLNIILEETADVLTVPYDAIQQDEKGDDVVYAVEHTENGGVIKTAIPVTVGVEGDYYVEVSGDIKEGMEISLPTDKTFDLEAMRAEMLASMGG